MNIGIPSVYFSINLFEPSEYCEKYIYAVQYGTCL